MAGGFPIGTCPSFLSFFVLFSSFLGLSQLCGDCRWKISPICPKGSATQSGPFPKKWETPSLETRSFLVFSQGSRRHHSLDTFKNLLMPLFLMGWAVFQGIFVERENGPLRRSGKRPIKVRKRPVKEGGNDPLRSMGCFWARGHARKWPL